jgi:magnesium transporter
MLNKYNWNKQKWTLINQGSEDELKETIKSANIDPYIAREIATPTPKPKIEFYKDSIYLILHFPAFKHSHQNPKQEIDFIIQKNGLVTIQYDNIDSLHKISKYIEVNEVLLKDRAVEQHIFTLILKELYIDLGAEMTYIEKWAESITDNIFKNKQKEMVYEISEAIRIVLFFEKILSSHKNILDFLRKGSVHIFGKDFSDEVESIVVEYDRLITELGHILETLKEIRETNLSILTTKQNETMKTLTVINFIGLPLMLISGIFAMNELGTPFVGNPNAFYIIIFMMLLALLTTVGISKHKKWI